MRLFVPFFTQGFSLGTIGDLAAVKQALDAVETKQWLISADCTWSIRNLTAGQGPIHVGFAHGDYSTTEIAEWFVNSGSWSQGDRIAQEQARRKCRLVGTFSGVSTEEVLNDGKPVRTRLNFSLEDGQSLAIFAINASGAALTTGSLVYATGKVYCRSL